MTIKLDNKLLKELILEAIEDYDVSRDPEAQAVLNRLPFQGRDLKQIADLMGVEPSRFQELLKNRRELRDLLELIAAETEMRASSANAMEEQEAFNQRLAKIVKEELEAVLDEKKKKKSCKPSKGKRFAKRVNGKCRSYGQAGKAKGGGDRIRPGTKKGDAYCARSAKIKKCKNPPCANDLSRKKWKCRGSKSMKE